MHSYVFWWCQKWKWSLCKLYSSEWDRETSTWIHIINAINLRQNMHRNFLKWAHLFSLKYRTPLKITSLINTFLSASRITSICKPFTTNIYQIFSYTSFLLSWKLILTTIFSMREHNLRNAVIRSCSFDSLMEGRNTATISTSWNYGKKNFQHFFMDIIKLVVLTHSGSYRRGGRFIRQLSSSKKLVYFQGTCTKIRIRRGRKKKIQLDEHLLKSNLHGQCGVAVKVTLPLEHFNSCLEMAVLEQIARLGVPAGRNLKLLEEKKVKIHSIKR